MEKHLRPYHYYSDLYDRHTVEWCRGFIERSRQRTMDFVDVPDEEVRKKIQDGLIGMTTDMVILFETGDRYMHKKERIEEMMREDEARDRLYENAVAPQHVQCLTCQRMMSPTLKHVDIRYGEPDRVLFMYECPIGCLPRRAFYNTGEEWVAPVPEKCPTCGNVLIVEDRITPEKFITDVRCSSCSFSKTEEIERMVKTDVPDPHFEADRARFCLSDEEDERWRIGFAGLERIGDMVKEWKEKEANTELYDNVAKMQKLTILDLEKMLSSTLEKEGYTKLQLGTPEITKDVIVPFGVYDSRSDRPQRESEYELKKILKKTLKDTNWRLMSDGVSYTLGYVSGRLRGYEREEDLVGLIKGDSKFKKK